MKILIVYITRHGCARKVAETISVQMAGETSLFDLKKGGKVNPDLFDVIILGASIHMGAIPKRMKSFCLRHQNTLIKKRLGIYLCHLYKGELAEKQFDEAFPQKLREHAVATGLLGGEFVFEKMNLLEKMIIRKIQQSDKSISRIDHQLVIDFIDRIKTN